MCPEAYAPVSFMTPSIYKLLSYLLTDLKLCSSIFSILTRVLANHRLRSTCVIVTVVVSFSMIQSGPKILMWILLQRLEML